MFNARELVVKSLMVLGKSLILAAISFSALADNIHNPEFISYRSGGFGNQLIDMSFGWFKKLDAEQKDAYDSALIHALEYSENGQKVEWYKNNASGFAVPAMTWQTGNGYCRRMHIQAIAYNVEKTMTATACFNNNSDNWRWTSGK